MGEVGIIGLDLAKNVFQVHGAAVDGSVVFRRKLSVSATPIPSCRWRSERVILRAHERWRFGLGTRRQSGRRIGPLEER